MKKFFAVALCAMAASSAQAYVVAGNDYAVSSASGSWAWDQSQHSELRAALVDTNNFGPGGIVDESVSVAHLGSNITASSLANVDLFVSSWWREDQSAAYQSTLLDFFYAGGDLAIFQDGPSRDGLGSALGFASVHGASNPNTVLDPLVDGPFGTVNPINQRGEISYLDNSAIENAGGTVCGTNNNGNATMACWGEGEFAAGAGSLTIFSDIDLISGLYGGANFNPLNDKGRLALNTIAFHIEDATEVSEPFTLGLMGLGLLGLGLTRRRNAKS